MPKARQRPQFACQTRASLANLIRLLDLHGQIRQRSDPAGKATFLQCEIGAEVSLKVNESFLPAARVDECEQGR